MSFERRKVHISGIRSRSIWARCCKIWIDTVCVCVWVIGTKSIFVWNLFEIAFTSSTWWKPIDCQLNGNMELNKSAFYAVEHLFNCKLNTALISLQLNTSLYCLEIFTIWKINSNINCTTIVIDEINSFLDLCNDFILKAEIHVELFGYHLVWVLSIHQKDYSPRQTIMQSCEQEFFVCDFVCISSTHDSPMNQNIKYTMVLMPATFFWGCDVNMTSLFKQIDCHN